MRRIRPEAGRLTWLAVLSVAALVAGLACGDDCNGFERPTGPDGAFGLAEAVPAEADAVVFAEELEELSSGLEAVFSAVPADPAVAGDLQTWRAAGAELGGPAAAYRAGDRWGVVAWADPERDTDLDVWSAEGERRDLETEPPIQQGWRGGGDESNRWAGTDGRRIAVGRASSQAETDRIWPAEDDHWEVDGHLLKWAGDSERDSGDTEMPRLFGAVDGSGLLERLEGTDRAGQLLDRLADRLGRVYWRLGESGRPDSRLVELYTPGRAGAPAAVGDLGEAREPLPDLGGLVRAGTPGVVRLSADPERFVELLRSTLEAGQRQYLDATLQTLRQDLQIDLESQVVDNVTGQVAVVIFGIDNAWFDAEGLELVASAARLETTREVVLVPFEDRDEIEALLDAFTQLSMGALRREAGEHTVQYAWFDDGLLEWAIVVADDHLAFVDSIVASDHVKGWRQSPRPLEGVFAERGVDSMLEGTRGMGVYLDVDTIETMLAEGGDDRRAGWLAGLEAMRLETDVDGTPEYADLELWLDEPVVDHEREEQ